MQEVRNVPRNTATGPIGQAAVPSTVRDVREMGDFFKDYRQATSEVTSYLKGRSVSNRLVSERIARKLQEKLSS